jgi:flagellar biosynthetic protein FlhB
MTDMDIYAPEDEGRTEKATPGKIKKARQEGRVARSGELTAVVSVLAAVVFMIFWGRHIVTELKWLFSQCVELAAGPEGSYAKLAAAALGCFCKAVLPLLLVVFAASLAAELAQVGFQFSWKPLRPRWDRLRRQHSSRRTGFQLGHALIKTVAAALVLVLGIKAELPKLCAMLDNQLEGSAKTLAAMAVKLLAEVALALLALAVVEYMFERIFHAESLKMTRREVLEEIKQENGDPVVKDMLRRQNEEQ